MFRVRTLPARIVLASRVLTLSLVQDSDIVYFYCCIERDFTSHFIRVLRPNVTRLRTRKTMRIRFLALQLYTRLRKLMPRFLQTSRPRLKKDPTTFLYDEGDHRLVKRRGNDRTTID